MKKKWWGIFPICLLSLFSCGNTSSPASSQPVDTDPIPMVSDPAVDYAYDGNSTNENGSMSYEIFVRSFYDSDGDGIGDLHGVQEKLPYLAGLGIKTLWLMPIHPSPSYHGYDVTDYFNVNPDFGTLEDFDSLVSEARKLHIDVMMDLVLNHCSINNQYFIDSYNDYIAGKTGENSKADWFNWGYHDHVYNGTYYESYFDAGMPDFNLDSTGVKAEMTRIIKFWIDKGVAGFRLDGVYYYYRGVQDKNIAFLNWIKETAASFNPNIYLVGECWISDGALNPYFASKCDSFFRFGTATGGDTSLINLVKGYGKAKDMASTIEHNEAVMRSKNANAYSSYFLSNHDQDRISKNFTAENNKVAASLYILLPGTPFMYYGEEISLIGKRTLSPDDYSDIKRRLPMIWSATDKTGQCVFPEAKRQDLNDTVQVTDGVEEKSSEAFSLLKHYKKVINIRNKYPFIKNGVFTSLYTALNTTEKSVMAYKITSGSDDIIVVHNFNGYNVKVAAPGTEIVDEINTSHRVPSLAEGMLTLGAFSTVIMK